MQSLKNRRTGKRSLNLAPSAAMEMLEERRLLSTGALDTSFGNAGKVTTDINNISIDNAFATVLQSDGKVIVGGATFKVGTNSNSDFAMVRYNTNGAVDTTFGAGGEVVTNFATGSLSNSEEIRGLALQSDGKIIAVGQTRQGSTFDVAVARYNTDGSLDSSFGTLGRVQTELLGGSSSDNGLAVAIQTDGKILVGGSTAPNGSLNTDFSVVRYNTNGSVDSSFGTGGVARLDINGGKDVINSIGLQSDDKIVAAGTTLLTNNTNSDIALARFNTNGQVDTSYGTNGIVTTDFNGGLDEGKGLAIQSDNKAIVVGSAFFGSNQDFALARYTTTGGLDPAFGTGGTGNTDFSVRQDQALAVTVQSNGKIVVVGDTTNSDDANDVNFAVSRYSTTGVLDTSFRRPTGGHVNIDFLAGRDSAGAVAIQSDGNIVVAGTADPTNSIVGDFAVARFIGFDATTDTPVIVTGTDVGATPDIRVFDGLSGATKLSFSAFDPGYLGGTRVASGDVNGDGTPDVIVGTGTGGFSNVRVFDGRTGDAVSGPLSSFLAFPGTSDPNNGFTGAFQGGVNVAAGDINGDGLADVIVAADAGGPPHVKVFSGANGNLIASFFAYDAGFLGGVRVASGDTNGDGRDDILTGAGPGAGPHVKAFSGVDLSEMRSYFAFASTYLGGVRVAAGDYNNDGVDDIFTAAGVNVEPHINVSNGVTGAAISDFFAYDPGFLSGVWIASADVNNDGHSDVIVGSGNGAGHVKVFSSASLLNGGISNDGTADDSLLESYFAYGASYNKGIFVAASR
ncbi:MAG TPA: FG-GAP-like repeat-containing protein [Tepidisphaeraceae bacterium]